MLLVAYCGTGMLVNIMFLCTLETVTFRYRIFPRKDWCSWSFVKELLVIAPRGDSLLEEAGHSFSLWIMPPQWLQIFCNSLQFRKIKVLGLHWWSSVPCFLWDDNRWLALWMVESNLQKSSIPHFPRATSNVLEEKILSLQVYLRKQRDSWVTVWETWEKILRVLGILNIERSKENPPWGLGMYNCEVGFLF